MVSFQGLRFHDRTPVYQQVAEHLKRQILLGLVEDGEPMPSRRELAAQTGINPNTAQKAYRLMTEEGLVRTEGNNVSTVSLTPERHAWIEDELTRGLVRYLRVPTPGKIIFLTKKSSASSANCGARNRPVILLFTLCV